MVKDYLWFIKALTPPAEFGFAVPLRFRKKDVYGAIGVPKMSQPEAAAPEKGRRRAAPSRRNLRARRRESLTLREENFINLS